MLPWSRTFPQGTAPGHQGGQQHLLALSHCFHPRWVLLTPFWGEMLAQHVLLSSPRPCVSASPCHSLAGT